MDQYETNFPEEKGEDTVSTAPEVAPVEEHRKESPFADSPYVMDWQPAQQQETQRPKPAKKKNGKVWKVLVASVLIVALVAAGCGITAYSVNNYWIRYHNQDVAYMNEQIAILQQQIKDNSFTGNGNSVSGTPNVSVDGLTPGQVYAKCVDSVVAITAIVSTSQGGSKSSGSGFVISEDGYIVTNFHVIEGATSVSVTTHDGEQYAASVVGYDDNNDFALLKAEATGLTAASLGSSSDLIVGDQVVAIGNPLGELSATLTVGYVSGKDRGITTDGTMINMIQTDAAINSGNSGGPLFNMKGEVVGITTAKYSGTTSSGASIEGIGFAIPIDDVEGKITEIQENGYVSTPYMGIEVTNQFDGMGVYVSSVEPKGAAAAAGMKAGDLIVKLGDTPITTLASLTPAMKAFKVGDTTTITVYRGGKLLELTITFGEKPHNTVSSPSQDPQEPTGEAQTPSGNPLPEDGSFKDWWEHFFGNGNG